MTVYYLDTSIWFDIQEFRGKNGDRALKFVADCIAHGDRLLYSDLVIQEVKQLGRFVDFNSVLARRVSVNRMQLAGARHLGLSLGIPRKDALHAILARDNDAVLVSNDRDFEKLRAVVEIKTTYD